MNIAILIMAAGLGRRFCQHGGGNKLLAEIDGIPLLSHTLHQALETGEDVYVVTRPEEANIHSLLQGCQRIDCQSDGLGESIAAGVRATAEYQGWIIALGDMPWLQTSSYQAVITALKSSPIVRPVVHGQPGHPVGFSQAFYAQLVGLKNDEGARSLLLTHPPRLLALNDPGCLSDVDYPAMLTGEKHDHA